MCFGAEAFCVKADVSTFSTQVNLELGRIFGRDELVLTYLPAQAEERLFISSPSGTKVIQASMYNYVLLPPPPFSSSFVSAVIIIPPNSPSYAGVPADIDFSFRGLFLTVHRPTMVRIWKFVKAIEFKALGQLEQA
jgi:hypothetical protein